MSNPHPSGSTSTAREWEKEASQLLNGMPPAIVLKGLEREELTLKNLKNFYMEEMERLQLEESLLLRQLEEMQQNPSSSRHESDQMSHEQRQQHMDTSHGGLMEPDAQEEQLVMLLQDEMAQVQMEEQMQLEHQHQQQEHQHQQQLSDEDN